MKIAILGSGGREHALALQISKSKKLYKLYCIPGNAGTNLIAKNIDLKLNNFLDVYNFLKVEKIDLVIVGPEKPLVDGIVDYLEKFEIKVFGPNKIAAQLEGSKIFTKKLCKENNIPTANFGIFNDRESSKKFLKKTNYPTVIKANNLASGKGVYICENETEAETAVDEIFAGKFGQANEILIEEFLSGEEMSFFILTDGLNIKNFGTAQDHKRVLEGDKGKNTGGMGAYSPSRLISDELEKKIIRKIIDPTLKAISKLGTKYKGFLYAGLMITNNEPYLIEYNVRMGDPECQTILPKLDTDLSDIILACCDGKLDQIKIDWNNKKSLCIVLCSKGYPDEFKKNIEIENLDKVNLTNNDFIFHAGTYKKDKKIFSKGGRVLNFVSLSDNFFQSRENNIRNLSKLDWSEGFYRKDIGFKVIEK